MRLGEEAETVASGVVMDGLGVVVGEENGKRLSVGWRATKGLVDLGTSRTTNGAVDIRVTRNAKRESFLFPHILRENLRTAKPRVKFQLDFSPISLRLCRSCSRLCHQNKSTCVPKILQATQAKK